MKKLMSYAVFCATALIIVSLSSCAPSVPKANLKTDIDSLSYAYGVQITQGLDSYLENMGFEDAEKAAFFKSFLEASRIKSNDTIAAARIQGMAVGRQVTGWFDNFNEQVFGPESTQSLNQSQFLAGFIAAARDKNALFSSEDASFFIETRVAEIQAKANEHLRVENQAFLDANKSKEGVITTESGIQYKIEREGNGPKPTEQNIVRVKYRGTDIHGVEFDSNEEAVFGLDRVISGWTEGIQLMSVGSVYTFYIPYNLAYGEGGNPPVIQPFATLIFDVELLEIVN
jgi:FKBP-type peptidyl-prolyl cis-trans isomerase FklB